MTPAQRRELTDRQHRHLSIVRQCQLMGVSRSSLYYRPKGTPLGDLSLMQAMDRQYLETPFYGSRRMKASLERQGMPVSRKRVQRLMRLMGLRAIYRQPRTSQPAGRRWVYPYLLRDLTITRANLWAADTATANPCVVADGGWAFEIWPEFVSQIPATASMATDPANRTAEVESRVELYGLMSSRPFTCPDLETTNISAPGVLKNILDGRYAR